MKRAAGICLTIVVSIVGCEFSVGVHTPPPKPPRVPDGAAWAGGTDGGAWVACSAAEGRDANLCTIYDETDGRVLSEGYFVRRDTRRAAKLDGLGLVAFDGARIYFTEDVVLDPLPLQPTTGRAP